MRNRRDLAILFLAALLLRLGHVAEIRSGVTFDSPVVDARIYDETARRVAADGLGALELPFYQPPLYPVLLAGVYRWSGGSTLAPRIIQALLGALTVALVFALARATGRRAGWIGGGLMAAYGVAIHFEGELLPPALLLVLIAGALALLLRADGEAPRAALAGAGVLIGLAVAARPSLALLGLGLVAWWWRGGRAAGRRRGASAALLTATIALPVLPFTLANRIVAGESVFVSTNGGINLYLGNGAGSDSLTAIQPGYHWDRLQIEPLRAGARTGSEESAYWTRRALREAAADPGAWAAALGGKVLRLLDVRETPRNTDYEDFRRDSRLLSLPLVGFGLVAPLAFLGLLLGGGTTEARRRRSLLATVLIAVAAENLLFFVAGRYRLEAVPALCALAGIGADAVLRRRGRIPPGAWAALLAVTAVVWIDFLGERAIDETRARIHRAVALRNAGRYARSELMLREAFRLDPTDVDVNRLLGQAAARHEDWEEAVTSFRRALEGADDHLLALLGAGTSLQRLGRNDEAEPYFRRAVDADPFDADARLGLGTCLAVEQRWSEAREQFSIGLRIDPGHAGLRANLRNLERLQGGSC